jgi:hypothetical protein
MEHELALGYIATIKKPHPWAWSNGEVVVEEDHDDLPTFLDRTSKKDEEARAEIKAEQEADKKRKTERRLAKLKIGQEIKQAELTGQRRRCRSPARRPLPPSAPSVRRITG